MSDLYMFVFSHVQNRFFRKHWLESLRYTQIRSHAQTPELLERRTMCHDSLDKRTQIATCPGYIHAIYPDSPSLLLSQEPVRNALATRSCCCDMATISKPR